MKSTIPTTLLIISVIILSINSFTIPDTAPETGPYNPAISKKYATYSSIAFCPKTCI
jgi:hypothetical protein